MMYCNILLSNVSLTCQNTAKLIIFTNNFKSVNDFVIVPKLTLLRLQNISNM